jgi:5-keto 4-deoxyuronate isomerase
LGALGGGGGASKMVGWCEISSMSCDSTRWTSVAEDDTVVRAPGTCDESRWLMVRDRGSSVSTGWSCSLGLMGVGMALGDDLELN